MEIEIGQLGGWLRRGFLEMVRMVRSWLVCWVVGCFLAVVESGIKRPSCCRCRRIAFINIFLGLLNLFHPVVPCALDVHSARSLLKRRALYVL